MGKPDDFDPRLKSYLRRGATTPPPAGFEARVVAGARRRRSGWWLQVGAAAAVLVMERHHGALLAGEAAVATVEIQVGVGCRLSVDVAGFGQPESGKQAPSRPKGTANTNLPQPRAPPRWLAQRVPRSPGKLHRFLHGVLRLLHVSQDGIGDGEQPAALRVDSGIEAGDIWHRLLLGHDHETIESD